MVGGTLSDIASKYFHGVDLGAYGLVTSRVSGHQSLAGQEVARAWTPGRSVPNDVVVRRSLEKIAYHCVVAEDTHDELVAALRTLRGYMSPELGWGALIVPDRPGMRTMARSLGFELDIDSLPYLVTVAEWEWRLERYPWWEDEGAQSVTIAGTNGKVYNTGQLETHPTYTCTVSDTLATGLTFSVGGEEFVYTGALVNADVLVIETDLPDVKLNGSRDFGNTSSAAAFPTLAVGSNAVIKSSADFSLAVSFRRRYE